jgi:hypothetical protein
MTKNLARHRRAVLNQGSRQRESCSDLTITMSPMEFNTAWEALEPLTNFVQSPHEGKAKPARPPFRSRYRWLVIGLGIFLIIMSVLSFRNRSTRPPTPGNLEAPPLQRKGEADLSSHWLAPVVCGPTTRGTFGTAVDFVDAPESAMTHAAQQHKLVFLLHISGNFEDCGFT